MVISSRHPAFADEKARAEKLQELKRQCIQKLAAVRASERDG